MGNYLGPYINSQRTQYVRLLQVGLQIGERNGHFHHNLSPETLHPKHPQYLQVSSPQDTGICTGRGMREMDVYGVRPTLSL